MSYHHGSIEGWLIAGFGFGLVLFVRGFLLYRKSLLVRDTPVIPVRSAAMGLVQIHGLATGESKVPSPVSGAPCYAYKVKIDRWQEGNRRGWSHYRTDVSGTAFYLQDSSGRIRVDPEAAEFDVPENCRREIPSSEMVSTSADALSALSISARGERVRTLAAGTDEYLFVYAEGVGGSGANRYRFTEYCVLPGQEYDILGTCKENPKPADANDHSLIAKGENETTYFISSKSGAELENSLNWKSTLMVWGGATLAVACAATWLARHRVP
ncbi:MAG TPA: GIDE domain-containing protein [Terriglobia bacterium]|nr:GIDE domain-containing protein [Terriglobia bacterium]